MLYITFIQNYGCVHLHALYSDIVKYGIIESDNHKQPQSLAEELLVKMPCTTFFKGCILSKVKTAFLPH